MYLLPSEDETRIDLAFADGQSPLSIDAMEVDELIQEVKEAKVPEDSTFNKEFIRAFRNKYGRKLSYTACSFLYRIKFDLIEAAKKKLKQQPEQSDSITSVPVSQNEISGSSD